MYCVYVSQVHQVQLEGAPWQNFAYGPMEVWINNYLSSELPSSFVVTSSDFVLLCCTFASLMPVKASLLCLVLMDKSDLPLSLMWVKKFLTKETVNNKLHRPPSYSSIYEGGSSSSKVVFKLSLQDYNPAYTVNDHKWDAFSSLFVCSVLRYQLGGRR